LARSWTVFGGLRPSSAPSGKNDRKEHPMNKVLSIAVGLAIGATAVATAQAGSSPAERIIAQERATGVAVDQPVQSPVERIVAQERARHVDPRLFGPSNLAPIQVVSPAGGFDWGDAGVGATAMLALTLLAAGGVTLRANALRQRAHG
jgi:hypothetical protein